MHHTVHVCKIEVLSVKHINVMKLKFVKFAMVEPEAAIVRQDSGGLELSVKVNY